MTSALTVDDRRHKAKDEKNEKLSGDESGRAFLHYSPENLSISHSDIEQGFNQHNTRCLKINRQTILSLFAISLAIVCFAFETVKIQKVIDNSRAIEIIKRDLESLKHRIYEEDFLDEIKAFEQQLYADEDGDPGETDINGDDYDSNYDDYDSNPSDYANDYGTTIPVTSQKPSTTSQMTSKSPDKDTELPSLLPISDKEEVGASKLSRTKQKRFITEEPPTHYVNGNVPVVLTSLLGNRKNHSRDNAVNPDSQSTNYPPKKYYERKHQRSYRKKTAEMKKSLGIRGKSRRHIRAPRQVFAAHYGADSAFFNEEDEHTGNGRGRHNEGIFKAWRASDWMDDFGMSRYFSLARDGRLMVHETGLYLVYAQIHYLDEHDENGFHMLVNGKPILQCMVYSPGSGHKSRSCFSAQVTYLSTGDRIVLKDVGPARYTLFQHDKSFFGLAKLGDTRQAQQLNQMRHNISLQPQTAPLR